MRTAGELGKVINHLEENNSCFHLYTIITAHPFLVNEKQNSYTNASNSLASHLLTCFLFKPLCDSLWPVVGSLCVY